MVSTTRLPIVEAKSVVVRKIAEGASVADAMRAVSRTVKTYENWRGSDEVFAKRIDSARDERRGEVSPDRVADRDAAKQLSFVDWRMKYLGRETYWHQHVWIDALEGREPEQRPGVEVDMRDPTRMIINCPPHHAKALETDTPMLTANRGWSTIGDLRIGDLVFAPDGSPVRVTHKSEIFRKPTYRVHINDGSFIDASEDHVWTGKFKQWSSPGSLRDMTTKEIALDGRPFILPTVEPLDLPEVDYLLDPYALGLWLGDGNTSDGGFTTADEELLQGFRDVGFEIKDSRTEHNPYRYYVEGLFPVLAELGIKGRKFVPEGYLLGSRTQRRSLLQGLMDTDGTVNAKGTQVSFTSTNKNLALAVQTLASTLGERASLREGRATLNGRDCGPKWMVYWAPSVEVPFRLARKAARCSTVRQNIYHKRITRVELIETADTQCIRVEHPDHLFLAGRTLVPTHNTQTLIDYLTYRLCLDQNFRCCILGARQENAADMLYQIRMRLTSNQFEHLQADFAPVGGFKPERGDGQFGANKLFLNGRTNDQKDPNLEALGWTSKIYGKRFDMILMDDVVDGDNAHDYEKQIRKLTAEVMSRCAHGPIVMIGTRIQPQDMYSELRDDDRFMQGESPWSLIRMPMVLQFADDPKDWVTLWPRSTQPIENTNDPKDPVTGEYVAWDGPTCAKKRGGTPPDLWALVYQQESLPGFMTFPPELVKGAEDGRRFPGPLIAGALGHPRNGMEGMWIIASMDPAIAGECFIVVGAVDRITGERWIMNAFVQANPTPQWIKDMIHSVTVEYGVHTWVIEDNAFQGFLTQDRDINEYLHSRNCRLVSHRTGAEKYDPIYGVARLQFLFGRLEATNDGAGRQVFVHGSGKIHLPKTKGSGGLTALTEQLIRWTPSMKTKHLKQDGPMALWMWEKQASTLLGEQSAGTQGSFSEQRRTRFMLSGRRNKQFRTAQY